MPTIAITVDCQAATTGKCYARDLVKVAEELHVPLTWMILVSARNPMGNVTLYHNEYLHRIPSWHEIGLCVSFENSAGYVSDPKERGDVIRLGKDVLKQCHVKPTSFRAHMHDLLSTDIAALEDIGVIVDASPCPGATDKHSVAFPDGPTQPYHPSYDNASLVGDAKLIIAPIATYQGVSGLLELGWDKVGTVVDHSLQAEDVTVLAAADDTDCTAAVRAAIITAKQAGGRFVTLTQLASG